MKLINEFDIPLPPAQAWPLLLDVERIVTCMPGAALIERVADDSYKGRVSVRLGPVTLAFEGIAKFVTIDPVARIARVEAQGLDKKGRGGAHATVAFTIEPKGDISKVIIDTDLQLSGSVAQYGRASGVIVEVAKDLVRQFSNNLHRDIQAGGAGAIGDAANHSAKAQTPVESPQAISGLELAARALWNTVLASVKRMFGRA